MINDIPSIIAHNTPDPHERVQRVYFLADPARRSGLKVTNEEVCLAVVRRRWRREIGRKAPEEHISPIGADLEKKRLKSVASGRSGHIYAYYNCVAGPPVRDEDVKTVVDICHACGWNAGIEGNKSAVE